MEERILTTLILITSEGEQAKLQIYVDNTISTVTASGNLTDAIIKSMGLSKDDHYEIYVKIPKNTNLRDLGLKTIDGIALIPSNAGQIPFIKGKPK